MAGARGAFPLVAYTALAWLLFLGGSIAVQAVDSHARLPAEVFLGAHALHACVALVLAFRGTRAVGRLGPRVVLVGMQAGVAFVVFVVMMVAHACTVGDCF
jgi:hypothetical protein